MADSIMFGKERTATLSGKGSGPVMASPHEIESARLSMLEARKALEDHETLKGCVASSEHAMLTRKFTKAMEAYLMLSARQR